MEFPSKIKLRAQRIFSVSDAELFWNKNGDRLAAHTERYQKKIVKTSEEGDIKYIVSAFRNSVLVYSNDSFTICFLKWRLFLLEKNSK